MMMKLMLYLVFIQLLMIDEASMVAKFEDFAKRDGRSNRRMDGQKPAYGDAIDTSKNVNTRE